MVSESVVEDVRTCLLGGQGDKCKIFVGVGLCERKDLNFSAVVVSISHDASKYVGGRVVTKYLPLKVKSHVASLSNKFKSFFYLPYNSFLISHSHDKGPLTSK